MQNHNCFLEKLSRLQDRVDRAVERADRTPGSVKILPVTKNHPANVIEWVAAAGIAGVGENRVQEAVGKQQELGTVTVRPGDRSSRSGKLLRWELIGHLQSNKAAQALRHFDVIQSVDSLKLLNRLDRLAGESGLQREILIQFNAGRDPGKFGFLPDAENIEALAAALPGLRFLRAIGLMTVAPLEGGRDAARNCFEVLRQIRDRLRETGLTDLRELSMGMSGDLEEAIEEGSTQIRVGSYLFGERY